MKSKKRVILVLICLILVVVCLVVLFKIIGGKNKYEGDIVGFKYRFGTGNPVYYQYDITVNEGKVYFNVEKYDDNGKKEINKTIDETYLEELSKIIKENKITEWNGFDEKSNGIYDGYGFKLEINYSNGEKIKANGYMKFPENYNECHEKLYEFLSSIE